MSGAPVESVKDAPWLGEDLPGEDLSEEDLRCDACSARIEGEPAARGLLVFPRGDGVFYEEPPLCAQCALAIGMTALWRWVEEEEGG